MIDLDWCCEQEDYATQSREIFYTEKDSVQEQDDNLQTDSFRYHGL